MNLWSFTPTYRSSLTYSERKLKIRTKTVNKQSHVVVFQLRYPEWTKCIESKPNQSGNKQKWLRVGIRTHVCNKPRSTRLWNHGGPFPEGLRKLTCTAEPQRKLMQADIKMTQIDVCTHSHVNSLDSNTRRQWSSGFGLSPKDTAVTSKLCTLEFYFGRGFESHL